MARLISFVGLMLVASAFADVEPSIGYHEAIGIPLAAKIKAQEDELLAHQGVATASDRIVGGAISPINEHPYLAGIIISFINIAENSACGSSLLSTNRLITAAHCWFDGTKEAWQFVVVLGSNFLYSGGTRIATSQVVMHPLWSPLLLHNDVAMIYLPTPVTFSSTIQPIALPSGTQMFEDFTGQVATAAGFGKTTDAQIGASSVLSKVSLLVITVQQCQAVFNSFLPYVQPTNICTSGVGGVGICGGDSGGPLYITRNGQKVLVGVSSFVARDACQGGHPSAFARVTSFQSWIWQHMF